VVEVLAMTLELVPTTLEEANAFIAQHHRHRLPVVGAKFCVAVAALIGADPAHAWPEVVGVVIAGRPVARSLDDGYTLEVSRCCTDGTRNACSMLYGAARRATHALGYARLITYTLAEEPGTSLRAAGFRVVGKVRGRSWSCPSRPRVDTAPHQDKLRWEAAT
jgi:hypothetical protein